ncbi:MAG: glutamate--tRNA ligase [Candidatus Bathyarchaeia archaeon]
MSEAESEIRELARKYAFQNALRHSGKASGKAVVGKILAAQPGLKSRLKELFAIVADAVEEVNRLTPEQQREEAEKWPGLLEARRGEEERRLPPLPNAERCERVVTRFSPNPDCVLHLGSVRAIILSHDYARMYDGLFILRFEDTDPRLKKSALEFYDSIRDDLRWLDCPWDAEYIQSDRIPIYYDHAEQLLEKGGAYVCTCPRDEYRKLILNGRPCPCRSLSTEDGLARWRMMLDGSYREGEAVYRVKTSLTHPNPAVRDWPAFRIIDPSKSPHPRVGGRYRVWPLYNFACGVDDHLLGVTHVIRGKEHMTNTVRQRYLYRYFGWAYPEAIHYGRLRIAGAELSKSKILQSVAERAVSGFDDPRLATLKALRRRGISPATLRMMITEVGVKPIDATISWENIYALNRKVVEPAANRRFYVDGPVPLRVEKVWEPVEARLPLHPDHPERGERRIPVTPSEGVARLLISRSDLKLASPRRVIRLIELFNVKVREATETHITAELHSRSVEEARAEGAPLIQWVNADQNIDVEILMPDASLRRGKGEEGIGGEKEGGVIQLVRVGFARVEEVSEEKAALCFAHE